MLDLTGRRFGDLAVVEQTDERHQGSVVWSCDCLRHVPPKRVKISAARLRYGQQSCGCIGDEVRKKQKQNFLYVIQQNSPDQFCKVGVTDDPKSRIGDLQVGNPHDLKYLCLLPLPLSERRERYEDAAHHLLRKSHTGGEWFALTGE